MFGKHLYAFVGMVAAGTALASTAARAQAPGATFGTCDSPAIPGYREVSLRSLHVPMPDGIQIALDLILPATLRAGTRLPAVLIATRYWRAFEGQAPNASQKFWVNHGYAVVSMDVRGTGASFGRWPYPWARDEINDLGEVVKWIVAQPWSNGKVGSTGTSYTANTAQFVAVSNHPALKAVIPIAMDFDLYTDEVAAGGLLVEALVGPWGEAVKQMDDNVPRGQPPRGVRPVDGDGDRVLLKAAIIDHAGNPPVQVAARKMVYRDQRVPEWGAAIDEFSVHSFRREIERSGVPIFGWGSWLDAGTANGVLARFLTFSNPQRVLIGPWSHGGGFHTSPYLPPDAPTDPSREVQTREQLCYFDQYLKDRPNGMGPKVLTYYTLGEERWKTTSEWPLPGTTSQRWYFGPAGALQPRPPAEISASDRYTVDFEATMGTATRWHTPLGGGDVIYPDRREADRRLLIYTSAPLDSDLEITGHPVVTLEVASTYTDGAFFIYLEDVDPSGRVTYVTEGQLRAIHRKVSTDPPPYRLPIPYHSFKEKDAQPLVPGELANLHFALLPTSVLIRQGHRIRLAIAGADKDTFPRIPAEGTPVITVARQSGRASFVELPVVGRR